MGEAGYSSMLNCNHGGEASGDKRRCKHQKGVWPQYKNPREISVELQEEIEPDAGWILDMAVC